jgi:undecaprenyl-diphosphatase
MSKIWEAIVLGIIQGLTEFLPVSSSGHLEIAKQILGDQSTPEQSLIMTVVLHFATACGTMYVFRKEIWNLLKKGLTFPLNDASYYIYFIVLSMIPAAIVGFFFEEAIEGLFGQNLILVGTALIATAMLLVLADRSKNTSRQIGATSALLIGIAQAIAIIPGISRSGATISTSVLLKINREEAARFSFLMVVPLIFGKIAKDLLSGELEVIDQMGPVLVGFVTAFVIGIIACVWMIALVKKARLRYFGWYCAIVGLVCILWENDVFS